MQTAISGCKKSSSVVHFLLVHPHFHFVDFPFLEEHNMHDKRSDELPFSVQVKVNSFIVGCGVDKKEKKNCKRLYSLFIRCSEVVTVVFSTCFKICHRWYSIHRYIETSMISFPFDAVLISAGCEVKFVMLMIEPERIQGMVRSSTWRPYNPNSRFSIKYMYFWWQPMTLEIGQLMSSIERDDDSQLISLFSEVLASLSSSPSVPQLKISLDE